MRAAYYKGPNSSSARRTFASGSGVVSLGVWQHFGVIFKGHNNVHMYLNGDEIPLAYTSGSGSGMTYAGYSGGFGHYTWNAGNVFTDGQLDEVRVYNRSLSANEMKLIALH